MNTWLLVRLAPDLDRLRIGEVFRTFAMTPGVEAVFDADMANVRPERMDVLNGEPVSKPKKKRAPVEVLPGQIPLPMTVDPAA